MRTNLKRFLFAMVLIVGGLGYAQVSGTVYDEAGFEAESASVEVEGKGISVVTDENGKFSIDSNVNVGDVLLITLEDGTEIRSEVLELGNQGEISVEIIELEGASIIGYGITESDNERAGAYSLVDNEELVASATTSFDQALQGRAAGVQLSQASGQPGAASPIFIRGIGSLTASTQPLFVVDGVPLTNTDQSNIATTQNPLASFNPNDIESVRVLKDAVATSIYGSRGSNGVILVTTKKGKKNKGVFTFSSEIGFGDVAYEEFDWLSAEENIEYVALARVNSGLSADLDQGRQFATDFFNWDGVTDTDWQDLTRNNVVTQQNYNISYRGGGENIRLYASLGYFDQDGVSRDADFDRITGNLRVNWDANEKLSLGFSMFASTFEQNGQADASAFTNPFFFGNILSRTQPAFNADGSPNLNLVAINGTFNPVAIQDTDINQSRNYRLLPTLTGEYEFLKNVTFRSQFSLDFQIFDGFGWDNPDFGDGVNAGDPLGNGNGFTFDQNILTWTWQNTVNFTKTFADVHDVSAAIGYEAIYGRTEFSQAWAQGYPSGRRLPQLALAANPSLANSSSTDYSFTGVFGRASYTYDNRYSVTGTYRIDESSRFGADNRDASFWSLGGTWNIHNESFLKGSRFVNQLKLRGGYGTAGNAELGANFLSVPTVSFEAIEGQNGTRINNPGNGELTWEESEQINLGLDFSLLDNKIFGSVDIYQKNSNSLLFTNAPIPPSSSGSEGASIARNIADLENEGIEVTLGWSPIRNNNLNWTLTGIFSFNKPEIETLLPNTEESAIAGLKRLAVGHDPSEFYTRLWAGVNPADGSPLWFTDESRTQITGDVNSAGLSFTGQYGLPRYLASLNNEFNYKNFRFTFLINYSGGNSVWDRWAFVYDSDGAFINTNKLAAQLYDSWTPDNPNASRPAINFNASNNASNSNSTRYLYDADYIRLRSAEIGYNLTNKILGNSEIVNNIYIYLKGFNLYLYTFDDDLYFDPEIASNAFATNLEGLGVYDATNPNIRQILLGVRINF